MIDLPTWTKKGKIYSRNGGAFFESHATRPIPYYLSANRLRLFFSSRAVNDMPYPTFIDVEADNPSKVIHICETPLLDLGRTGTFDDSGITPVCIYRNSETGSLMYYVGWKRRRYGVTIEASIGVAKLISNGTKLERIFEGPILAQNPNDPLFVAAPFVIPKKGGFHMWYCSGTEWRNMEQGPEMLYTVFEATSPDGVNWEQIDSSPTIDYEFDGEVISAPWVVNLKDGRMLMWYSYRGSNKPNEKNYTPGLALKEKGSKWRRIDNKVNISKSKSGWDSEMICYPAIFNYQDTTYMFYSGNGVGKGGIGYAVADQKLEILDW